MVLSALAVVYINTEETLAQGAQQMAAAYQVWDIDSYSVGKSIAYSLANSLIMVTVICLMTFVIVLLYRNNCMKCLIGYMIVCSTTLLGFLGGHMYWVAIQIYRLPVDKFSYYLVLWNFAVVGVLAVFMGAVVPKYITQGYLIATSVILAWHLDYFDEYTTWCLLFMLALYDLCAVLTPCGPLKALVKLMSREDAPDMPGLLYEAELPEEAKRPGLSNSSSTKYQGSGENETTLTEIPLAVARVYSLPVKGIPHRNKDIFGKNDTKGKASKAPLLESRDGPLVPEDPTEKQLRASVLVQMPENGGKIERHRQNRRTVYLEKDRYGEAKRVLWVNTKGKVYAEASDGKDFEETNTIRLGLGDFIFYSVLVAKAAQYSFTTFAACVLVILTGLGSTLVLLSVFHHALPALPISICLGIFFYIFTRVFIEPWVEEVLTNPYYV